MIWLKQLRRRCSPVQNCAEPQPEPSAAQASHDLAVAQGTVVGAAPSAQGEGASAIAAAGHSYQGGAPTPLSAPPLRDAVTGRPTHTLHTLYTTTVSTGPPLRALHRTTLVGVRTRRREYS